MPAILSRPLRRDVPAASTPLADVESEWQTSEAKARTPSVQLRRISGFLCLVFALLLAGIGVAPIAAVAFEDAQAGRAAALATATDLLAHPPLVSPADTASTQGSGPDGSTSNAVGRPGACAPGNRDAVGEDLVINVDTWICGDVTVYAANLSVLGRVNGDVRVIGGSIVVVGEVRGSVTSVGGNVDLQPGAEVGGNVQSLGGSVNQSANAAVRGYIATGGDALQSDSPTHALDPYSGAIPWFQLLFWGLAGAALALLFPQYVMRVRTMAQRQLAASFVSGVLAIILAAVLVVALLITLIGIPLALVLIAALWLGWVVGNVALGSWLGGTLLRIVARDRRSMLLSTLVGVLLLATLETLPYVGWPIFALAGLLGLGAVIRSYFAARRAKRALRNAA